jgi:RimJ/RimL family protein N-acetyltransferase
MIPELRTKRLKLRAICADDIPAFVPLLNDFDVVRTLAPVPHPYLESDGRAFIARTERSRAAGLVLNYAVERADGTFIGFCTANIEDEGRSPGEGKRELGYWYGKTYWGQGYATEAASVVVEHAFDKLRAHALTSGWFTDNPASGRVLEKLGFLHTGMVERNCLARGCTVVSNRVQLTRTAFAGRARA